MATYRPSPWKKHVCTYLMLTLVSFGCGKKEDNKSAEPPAPQTKPPAEQPQPDPTAKDTTPQDAAQKQKHDAADAQNKAQEAAKAQKKEEEERKMTAKISELNQMLIGEFQYESSGNKSTAYKFENDIYADGMRNSVYTFADGGRVSYIYRLHFTSDKGIEREFTGHWEGEYKILIDAGKPKIQFHVTSKKNRLRLDSSVNDALYMQGSYYSCDMELNQNMVEMWKRLRLMNCSEFSDRYGFTAPFDVTFAERH